MTETVSRVRAAGGSGQLTVRADGACYSSKAMLATAGTLNVRFSVTVRQDKRVRAAGDAIEEEAWQPIPYWLSTPEVSGADVAETSYTAFTGRDALPVRLIVRRTRPTRGSQLALFTAWSYHAVVTYRAGETLELEADHRRHAVVEQVISPSWKSAGLAHLPSGSFMANAAWLALTVLAHKQRNGTAMITLRAMAMASAHGQDAGRRSWRRRPVRTSRPGTVNTVWRRVAAVAAEPHPRLKRPGARRSRQTGGTRPPMFQSWTRLPISKITTGRRQDQRWIR